MLLNTQLKRGYLGIAGLLVLSGMINLGTGMPQAGYEFVRARFEPGHCKNGHRAQWKLASTPLDIPALPLRKIKICRA